MSEPHERLGEAMNRRRLNLRMNWRELAGGAGISYEALRSIRRGEYRPSQLTAQALDRALQWTIGSVEAVLAGGEPTPVVKREAPPQPGDDLEERLARILANPAARQRLKDIINAARLPEADEDDERDRRSDAG